MFGIGSQEIILITVVLLFVTVISALYILWFIFQRQRRYRELEDRVATLEKTLESRTDRK